MPPSSALSPLSLAILGLVSLQPQSGYDLRKLFTTTPMGHFSSSPGAIYPALERLERGGLLQGSDLLDQPRRPKRIYAPTKEGRQVLTATLAQPVTAEAVIWHLDELMLRFSFMGDVLDRHQTLAFLQDFLVAVERYAANLDAQLKAFPPLPSPTPRLALAFGRDSYLSAARWARQALKELEP